MNLNDARDLLTRHELKKLIPIAGATEKLQRSQILRTENQRTETLSVVKLLEANRSERRRCGSRSDRIRGGGIGDSAEALDGEFFEENAIVENGVHSFGSERARSTRKLLQALAVHGESFDSCVGELAARAELEAREIRTTLRDLDERVVLDARGSAIAFERELRHRVESREERRDEGNEILVRVERETVAALSFDLEPPPANEGAAVAIGGAE